MEQLAAILPCRFRQKQFMVQVGWAVWSRRKSPRKSIDETWKEQIFSPSVVKIENCSREVKQYNLRFKNWWTVDSEGMEQGSILGADTCARIWYWLMSIKSTYTKLKFICTTARRFWTRRRSRIRFTACTAFDSYHCVGWFSVTPTTGQCPR